MAPERIASLLLDQLYNKPGGLRLRAYRGDSWEWDGVKYNRIPQWDFKLILTREVRRIVAGFDKKPKITTHLVNNVLANLQSTVVVKEETDIPTWIEGAEHPATSEKHILTMKNGLVS